ncbi:TlyA family RNA methyltransferase [Nonomuraea polychroma]|uniref:TlyA family RNA methyltransferase n=1 Tax=Nonomuraea polychroma TaxID=46176 RepID=UPI003D919AB3
MTRRIRLDSELVRRGLARSREQAAQLIDAGRVSVGGQLARKPATQVDTASPIVVAASEEGPDYVSRGAHKLLGALDTFRSLTVEGRRCLDAGASTGGFTDVLLRRGAAHVLAVDVGYGQLAWSLRTDERVTVMERVNVRDLTADMVGEPPTLIVGDLSFISLRLVLPALAAVAAPQAEFVLLVKPQFEVGKELVGAGGVVRDPELRRQSVRDAAAKARELGLTVRGVTASPLPGPSGNVEYLLWLGKGEGEPPVADLEAEIQRAVAEGPQ